MEIVSTQVSVLRILWVSFYLHTTPSVTFQSTMEAFTAATMALFCWTRIRWFRSLRIAFTSSTDSILRTTPTRAIFSASGGAQVGVMLVVESDGKLSFSATN